MKYCNGHSGRFPSDGTEKEDQESKEKVENKYSKMILGEKRGKLKKSVTQFIFKILSEKLGCFLNLPAGISGTPPPPHALREFHELSLLLFNGDAYPNKWAAFAWLSTPGFHSSACLDTDDSYYPAWEESELCCSSITAQRQTCWMVPSLFSSFPLLEDSSCCPPSVDKHEAGNSRISCRIQPHPTWSSHRRSGCHKSPDGQRRDSPHLTGQLPGKSHRWNITKTERPWSETHMHFFFYN